MKKTKKKESAGQTTKLTQAQLDSLAEILADKDATGALYELVCDGFTSDMPPKFESDFKTLGFSVFIDAQVEV